jgi:SOS-response transcriptional repressor LexA
MFRTEHMLKYLGKFMEELTELQERCLNIIGDFLKQDGRRPPTRRELMDLLNQKSINGVNQILRALQKKGYVRLGPVRQRRNIALLKRPLKQLDLFESFLL